MFSATEFIAEITPYILEKSFKFVRYYSWCSNRSRGEWLKAEKVVVGKEIELVHLSSESGGISM